MRVLTIGNFGTGWDGSICDEEHIAQALEELGHEVYRLPRGEYDVLLENEEYDFILIAQWDGYDGMMLDQIRKHPAPIVYWAFDHQADGQEWHEKLVMSSDLYLSKPLSDSKYPNWRWCSQDFAPSFLDQAPPAVQDIDVLFTGSWVPWESGKERVKYLKAIQDAGFNLQINSVTADQWRAEGFKNVQGPAMDDALPGLIARAKINFSMDHVYAPGYWSDRNAQIMCCGGFVLFRHVPLSEAVFHRYIGYFHSIEGCLEMIGEWIERDEDRQFFAAQGYEYAQRHLKVGQRVQEMLVIVSELLPEGIEA